MKFKARAKSAKPCAFARCKTEANKIYQDADWRIIACSQAHADIARGEIDKVPPEYHEQYFGAKG